MRGWVIVGGLVVAGLLVVGLILTAVQRARLNADREECLYRLKTLGQFAHEYAGATAKLKPADPEPENVLLVIPSGTVFNPSLEPDRRLSWVAASLPFLDQRLQGTAALSGQLDPAQAWDAGPNREVAATRLTLFVCPGALPDTPPGEPAPTQFVGLSGIGSDSATLPLKPLSPLAGCFRYDTPTPLQTVRENDGLSTTYLFAETGNDLGPWIRGGFSTVRGLDVSDGAKRPLGRGGQFGGNYPGVAAFGNADGSAKFVRESMNAQVLRAHFTIAGKDDDPLPGD